ncbi:ABC transporter substrate-binding protein [Kushneria indalinina]|uniref:Carbohydrate ABC transporter substrate-binding protein (CUT1 family) n=1 Tax=Kushneria indalinina DSM 14324 TaxID=1122140 RepID=A0A3D9DTX3_9GAMM|nr:ABC transporter substrate-binding protein [Kushneria indalinina]REC93859.1 carbohydrate ABC transporter substrate-binding protein (CUT1 family) [Kushneria indalinina DSM 14324]
MGLALSGGVLASGMGSAASLVINSDHTDPAARESLAAVIEGFENTYPDIKVTWNRFATEGYKSSIRNFLAANPPDIVRWYAGNRMLPFVEAGLFADISDLWQQEEMSDAFPSMASSLTYQDKQWAVPYSYYPWGIYYRADIFEEQGITPPEDWQALLAASRQLKDNGITPFAIGSKALWPAAGWFDYINLRLNGYDFHMQLTRGEADYTDPRVKNVFDHWAELVKPGFYNQNHAALEWQDAVPLFAQGEAAMYLMGSFTVEVMKSAGLEEAQIGLMRFPTIDRDVADAVEAPTEMFATPANAPNPDSARKFLAYVARPDVQAEMNRIAGTLPANRHASVDDSPLTRQATALLSGVESVSQFYDRDVPPRMAKVGMQGFQEFMVRPDQQADILQRLDQMTRRLYR